MVKGEVMKMDSGMCVLWMVVALVHLHGLKESH